MSKPFIAVVTIVVIALAGFGGWWFVTLQPAQQSSTILENPTSTAPKTQQATPTTDTSGGITIVFTNNGFEKQNYSVAKGKTVTVENDSTLVLEFSSDEHPTHTNNPELNIKAIQPGQQRTFTPERTGEWGIHDHEHPEFTTKLTVTE